MDVTIRLVKESDFAQWQSLWTKYNSFYGRDSFPSEITQLTWSRFLDVNEPMYALVAEKDKALVGIAHYLFHRSTTQIKMDCYLQDLYTNENIRGLGIGRKLIETVHIKALAVGSKSVYWQTHEDNITARKLYDKVAQFSGFIVYTKT